MKTIEFLIGIPGSGKSTYAKSVTGINPWHSNCARVNKDDLRAANPKLKERDIIALQEQAIIGYANQNIEKIIIDNTHMNPVHLIRATSLAKQLGYELVIKWFDDSLDAELCHKRNIKRTETVPHTVIENMYRQYFELWMARENHVIARGSRKVIVVDIDGTVANNDGHRGFFEWHKVGADKPHQDIIDLVKETATANDYGIIFLSGRDEVCYEETLEWLNRYFNGFAFSLYMRKKDDMRKDWIVKFELYMNAINGRCDVKYWFDDRFQVTRMVRAMGLRCISVENGFF